MSPNPVHLDLEAMARQVLRQYGFEPDFPAAAKPQVAQLLAHPPQLVASGAVRDLRHLLWSSIDNDTSRDLDQIEFAERLPDGSVKVLVGIADVDAYVPKNSPIDQHAAQQTCTLYTGIQNFSMIPDELSTGLTSLLEGADKLSRVTEFVVGADGHITASDFYGALVRNQAQLAYNAVGAWLEGRGPAPEKVAASPALEAQLKLQDEVAQILREQRYRQGALNLDTNEVRPIILNDEVVDVQKQTRNHATDLIEDFMIAANGMVARKLETVSSLRRIVKTPERWDRIVQLASSLGGHLPGEPNSKALNDFLLQRKAADPVHFADLSLAMVKLIGPGEYVLERPGDAVSGHFGLAVQDYTHSTAPNRRFPDLVTQRILKAVLAGQPPAYTDTELAAIAANCTVKGNAARKVERGMAKRLSAVAMSQRIGQVFDAIVTGVNEHGSFVRALTPHVDGMLVRGEEGLDVGDKVRVRLVRTDVSQGYIDFEKA
jgi:VacB/RNase II family 3'-5' exoribonuclease